ncbi:MAG: threonine synthase [Actinomycetia bacterium]|nr:threonine synthase [Actinomycetes bacterium]
MWPGVIERYRAWLPVSEHTPVVTLREGNTPLVEAPGLLGRGKTLWLKFEGLNPTGSFKDRGMTLAVSKAKEAGARTVICASTGNTSAAAAAYAARAGMTCVVVIPDGRIAVGKLAQALAHGARVVALAGNFDEALAHVRALAEQHPALALVNSVNPFRLEGQKTAAFEIVDALGHAPTHLALPVGNAGNITAYGMGFRAYRDAGRIPALPRLLGFQAAGAAPLVLGHPVEHPETVATAIRIGRPASGERALAAVAESGGRVEAVTDAEILDAYRRLATTVGILAEPASCAAVAGVLKLEREGYFAAGDEVVVVLTGHGLKDPDTARAVSGVEPIRASSRAEIEALLELATPS